MKRACHDQLMIQSVKARPNTAIPWLLMASFLYYHRPDEAPILSDEMFDRLCQKVNAGFDLLAHRHKHLIERRALDQGSLFYLRERDYPLITRSAAIGLSKELENE